MIVQVKAVANCYFKDIYHVCGDQFEFELQDGKKLPDCLEQVEPTAKARSNGATQTVKPNHTSKKSA